MENTVQKIEQPQEVEKVEVLQVSNVESLAALNKSEIDIQIATAKQYPRNLSQVLNNIETLATMDEETAASCFYILRREGKAIEGPSIRLAEIIASSWGNLRVQGRIIGNDGKKITAQGVCHDLESNYAASTEVNVRITYKNGKTYSDDMQITVGGAACSKARRNAIMMVVPYALIKKIIAKAKKVSLGKATSLEESRKKMLDFYQKIGVDQQHIFDYLSISKIEEIDMDMVVELRGLATAIKEETTTVQETFFPKPVQDAVAEDVKPGSDLFMSIEEKGKK